MMATDVDVVVVGGGISGLAAAFGLQKSGYAVELLEAQPRVGGVIGSRRRDGVLYELGPNSTLDTTPLINELLDDVGLRQQRAEPSAAASIRYVVRDGKPIPLPTSAGGFLTTPAFTLGAKLRLFKELFVAPTPPGVEESIAAFVRRRLGNEFLDYAIDPFVAGIYAGDPERISVPAAFPRLLALEQKYGGLIKGQIRGARERKKSKEVAKNTAKSFSFRDGMQTLTDGVGRKLDRVRCGVRVRRVEREAPERFRIEGEQDGATFVRRARAVVIATPAYAAADIVRDLAPGAARALAAIEYAPIAVVAAAFRRADVVHSCEGFGFLVPRKERRKVLGSLFSTSMFANRGPEGTVLFTTFAGGRRDPEIAAMADDAVVRIVRGELEALVGAGGPPLWTEVVRWPQAIPQYDLGHLARIGQIEQAERELPGLLFCANYKGGVSVSDCIKNGHGVAATLAGHIGAPAATAAVTA
ncbi:MAG: protoporphyrinogen oxidase [Betaproteobacteria bacterium]|nr:protoporphyrinogen oxidase [Betaproteobacteria bacterium]